MAFQLKSSSFYFENFKSMCQIIYIIIKRNKSRLYCNDMNLLLFNILYKLNIYFDISFFV